MYVDLLKTLSVLFSYCLKCFRKYSTSEEGPMPPHPLSPPIPAIIRKNSGNSNKSLYGYANDSQKMVVPFQMPMPSIIIERQQVENLIPISSMNKNGNTPQNSISQSPEDEWSR